MNFFAHYLVDEIPHNAQFNAALIAPDLFRHYLPNNNRFAWDHLVHNSDIQQNQLTHFCQGSLQHIQRDKLFHQSLIFKEIYEYNRENWLTLSNQIGLGRWWFSLHVSIELILDKILIKNNLNKLILFYQTLQVEKNSYLKFLEIVQHPAIPQFDERMDRFLESQYLFHYQEFSGLAYALYRIHASLNIPTPWHSENIKLLVIAMEDIETSIIANIEIKHLVEVLKTNG